jgi:hypothetical protein
MEVRQDAHPRFLEEHADRRIGVRSAGNQADRTT